MNEGAGWSCQAGDWLREGFRWRDGPRLVRYAGGAAAEILGLLALEKLTPFVLLTTPRAAAEAPDVAAAAAAVAHVPSGPVPEAAAAVERRLLDEAWPAAHLPLVALGGGRVIDAAKALGAAHRLDVAALPTTLSGAEMTPLHRPLPDGRGAARLRPRLVVTDPDLLSRLSSDHLAATAMNAFGHALEALYLPGRNPVASLAALEGVRLLVGGLEAAESDRAALALGGLLAGYAIGSTGLGWHHALCQTIVRETEAPHAQVYAVMAPHALRYMAPRAPRELAPLMALLADRAAPGDDSHAGTGRETSGRDSASAEEVAITRVARLAAMSGVRGLAELGVAAERLPVIAETAARRPEVRAMAPRLSAAGLLALLRTAL